MKTIYVGLLSVAVTQAAVAIPGGVLPPTATVSEPSALLLLAGAGVVAAAVRYFKK